MMANIRAKPSRLATTAVRVIQTLVRSIITRLPRRRITAESRPPMLWFRDWPMVSTSLVTRERTSPVVVRL